MRHRHWIVSVALALSLGGCAAQSQAPLAPTPASEEVNPLQYETLAQAHEKKGEKDQAIHYYRLAAQHFKKADFMFQAYALSQNLADLDQAESLLVQEALVRHDASTPKNLAIFYEKQGQREKAARYYRMVGKEFQSPAELLKAYELQPEPTDLDDLERILTTQAQSEHNPKLLEQLASFYESRQQPEKAAHYHQLAKEIKSSTGKPAISTQTSEKTRSPIQEAPQQREQSQKQAISSSQKIEKTKSTPTSSSTTSPPPAQASTQAKTPEKAPSPAPEKALAPQTAKELLPEKSTNLTEASVSASAGSAKAESLNEAPFPVEALPEAPYRVSVEALPNEAQRSDNYDRQQLPLNFIVTLHPQKGQKLADVEVEVVAYVHSIWQAELLGQTQEGMNVERYRQFLRFRVLGEQAMSQNVNLGTFYTAAQHSFAEGSRSFQKSLDHVDAKILKIEPIKK